MDFAQAGRIAKAQDLVKTVGCSAAILKTKAAKSFCRRDEVDSFVDISTTRVGSEHAWGDLHPLIESTLFEAGVPYDCATDLCSQLRPWVEACRDGLRTEASVPPQIRLRFDAAAAVLIRFLHETNREFVSRLIDKEIDYHISRRKLTLRGV